MPPVSVFVYSVAMFQCFNKDYFTVGLLFCLFICFFFFFFMFTELKLSE